MVHQQVLQFVVFVSSTFSSIRFSRIKMMSLSHQKGRREVLNPGVAAISQNNWARGKYLTYFQDFSLKKDEFIKDILPKVVKISKYSNRFQVLGTIDLPSGDGTKSVLAESLDDFPKALIKLPTEKSRKNVYYKIDLYLAMFIPTVTKKDKNGVTNQLTTGSLNCLLNAIKRIFKHYASDMAFENGDYEPITIFDFDPRSSYRHTAHVVDWKFKYLHQNGINDKVISTRTTSNEMPYLKAREFIIKVMANKDASPQHYQYAVFVSLSLMRAFRGGDARDVTMGCFTKHVSELDGTVGWELNTIRGKKNNKATTNNQYGDAAILIRYYDQVLARFGGMNMYHLINGHIGMMPKGWADEPNNAFFLRPKDRIMVSIFVLCFVLYFSCVLFVCYVLRFYWYFDHQTKV